VLPASLCAKIMVFRRITRIIEVVLNERAVSPDVYFPEMDADFKNFTLSLKKQNLTI